MSQGINYAGALTIEKVEILSTISKNNLAGGREITPQLMKIQIYESIFYPFVTATVYIKDASDLINTIPIRGEEIINIVASTPTLNTKINFALHVHRIADKYQERDRVNVYALKCVSLERVVDSTSRFSRGFYGTVSNLAKDIITNQDYGLGCVKPLNIEPTSNSIRYVSNYWTPLENIDYLTKSAVSLTGNHKSYVFFENRDGYNFVSLESLYQTPSIQTFIKDNNSSGTQQDVQSNYGKIETYESVNLFDYYKNSSKGIFSSNQINYDILFKAHRNYRYLSTLDTDRVVLNKTLPFTASLVKTTNNYLYDTISHTNLYNEYEQDSDVDIEQSRMSRVGLASYHDLRISVAGRSDYTSGKVVDIKIPRDGPIRKGEAESPWDPLLSGRYIISEVQHNLDGSGHNCIMTLIKDSLQ